MPRVSEPPPQSTMPWSIRSAARSGLSPSRAALMASTIASKGSARASRISSLVIVALRGRPLTASSPQTSSTRSSSSGKALPMSIRSRSAAGSPVRRL